MAVSVFIKRSLIFIHRWLGIALCVVFLVWFPSGIGMMYWDFPEVTAGDRLERVAGITAAVWHASRGCVDVRQGNP